MAGYLNKVCLIGNVGQDPELNDLSKGGIVANFSLATSESWKDKNSGEKKERTEWHRIVVFSEGLCNVIEQYVRKGMRLYVEGQLQTRKWQDKDGNDRYSTEVVLTGFDAKLIMLDRGSSSDRDPNGNADRPGNKKPGDSYAEKSGGTARDRQNGGGSVGYGRDKPAGDGGSFGRALDDEIPF